ncbi:MAG: tRNA guanosine(34) transglycosylase Tgt [Candidatus Levybacteria bacterium CG10_big_fil_rev_8_21_14_0_10_35_13]|nr:MAG: tRNA guanosine(34) transglycosylase Tgt [Candidatus Levybacteria bacterium CG10_big_fil_rev_8_21_14_0_10_35_13]
MTPSFKIIKKDKRLKARAGVIHTPHGDIETPGFIPVGTLATVKAVSPRDLKEMGAQIVLANTYHLHLRPGEDLIKKMGGLAKFMGWEEAGPPSSRLRRGKPTMTDSGGFQVFSLGIGLEKPGVKFLKDDALRSHSQFEKFSDSKHPSVRKGELGARSADSNENFSHENAPRAIRLNKITEEGVEFQSHIDGSRHKLTPESSIEIQEKLGADLIVAFDDLESPTYSEEETKKSLELTNGWEVRSKKAQKRKDQLLYGVTHGGKFENLRRESAKFVNENFDAIALGGAHANKKNLYEVIEWTVEELDDDKPRHLLGIGEVDDIFESVERGVDTFDCVIPTRIGRTGFFFISPSGPEDPPGRRPPFGSFKNRFRTDIDKPIFRKDPKPLDENCNCYTCQNFSRAYIHHLFRNRELLSYNLLSLHNVHFLVNLTKQIREAIINGDFQALKKKWLV